MIRRALLSVASTGRSAARRNIARIVHCNSRVGFLKWDFVPPPISSNVLFTPFSTIGKNGSRRDVTTDDLGMSQDRDPLSFYEERVIDMDIKS